MEFDRFIEFAESGKWWSDGGRVRENLVFDKVTINSEYIATMKRYPVGPLEFVDVRMVDRTDQVIIDKTYEDMKALLKVQKAA